MNVFAKFDKIPSMILQDIKETKRYEHTHGRTDNVKTVYPPTNTVCGGYNHECKVLIDRSQFSITWRSLLLPNSTPQDRFVYLYLSDAYSFIIYNVVKYRKILTKYNV